MPGSTLFKAFVLFVALWAPITQAESVGNLFRKLSVKARKIPASIRLFALITA